MSDTSQIDARKVIVNNHLKLHEQFFNPRDFNDRIAGYTAKIETIKNGRALQIEYERAYDEAWLALAGSLTEQADFVTFKPDFLKIFGLTAGQVEGQAMNHNAHYSGDSIRDEILSGNTFLSSFPRGELLDNFYAASKAASLNYIDLRTNESSLIGFLSEPEGRGIEVVFKDLQRVERHSEKLARTSSQTLDSLTSADLPQIGVTSGFSDGDPNLFDDEDTGTVNKKGSRKKGHGGALPIVGGGVLLGGLAAAATGLVPGCDGIPALRGIDDKDKGAEVQPAGADEGSTKHFAGLVSRSKQYTGHENSSPYSPVR